MKSNEILQSGDWIKCDAIGLGFYEVEKIGEFFINLKCLKIFGKPFEKQKDYIGHITNVHHGIDKLTGLRIPIDQKKWFLMKVKRIKK